MAIIRCKNVGAFVDQLGELLKKLSISPQTPDAFTYLHFHGSKVATADCHLGVANGLK